MTTRVLSHLGADTNKLFASLPGVEVVDVGRDEAPAPDVRADVLVTFPHPSPVLDALDRIGVRWIHIVGAGIDNFPVSCIGSRIATCSRGAGAGPISEYVLAMMLAFEKRIPEIWESERAGAHTDEPPSARGTRLALGGLAGRTAAVVGLGSIGAAVARKALAFDMRVLGMRRNPGRGAPEGVELVPDLVTMLGAADHVVVTAALTANTRHLIGGQALAAVKHGAHLVNISRGGLVDQEALRDALADGRIARATLDVTEPEPLPADHWLRSHPNVRLTPHISWSSPVGLRRSYDLFVVNLHHFLRDEPLVGLVDPAEGY